jgi:hypothetical protein
VTSFTFWVSRQNHWSSAFGFLHTKQVGDAWRAAAADAVCLQFASISTPRHSRERPLFGRRCAGSPRGCELQRDNADTTREKEADPNQEGNDVTAESGLLFDSHNVLCC